MPYKRKGKKIYVKKGGKWRLKITHKSVQEAKAHLYMLNTRAHPDREDK